MAAFAQALTFFCTRDLARMERFYGGTLGLAVAMRTPTAILWRVNDGAHMSPEGYLQFGDPIYGWLKVCLARDQ